MGHIQSPTPVQVNNNTVSGIVNNICKQIRSKAIDIRFYWIIDRIKQKQFYIYWAPGISNLGDYVSKHYLARHYIYIRPIFLFMPLSPKYLIHIFVPSIFFLLARVC